jgi:hypothetical protein
LTLTRETLMPLQTTELGAINGGTSPVVVTVVGEEGAAASFAASVRFCSAVPGFTLNQAQHSFGGSRRRSTPPRRSAAGSRTTCDRVARGEP